MYNIAILRGIPGCCWAFSAVVHSPDNNVQVNITSEQEVVGLRQAVGQGMQLRSNGARLRVFIVDNS